MSERRLIVTVIGAVLILVLLVGFGIRSCSAGRETVEQARVDVQAADAYAAAASNAVATVTTGQERETNVDAVVSEATENIKNAPDPVAARAAVVDAVCKLRAYRDRPECAVQSANPR